MSRSSKQTRSRGLRVKSKTPGHYKLFWVVDGIVKEEISKDRPVPFYTACWRADYLEQNTHRIGQIDVVHENTSAQTYKQLKFNFP